MFKVLFLAGLGLGAGWMINYLADVLPLWRKITTPKCANCLHRQFLPQHLYWAKRCPYCGYRHPYFIRTWMVNIVMIGATIWLGVSPPERIGFLWGLVLLILFALIVVIDLEHRLILHPVSITGGLLGLAVGVRLHGLLPTLVGGAVGFGVMYLLYKFGELFVILVSRIRGEQVEEIALGFGDVNLAGVLGFILGFPVILIGIILAILAGGIISFFYLLVGISLRRYQGFEALPYAPFLVFAAVLLIYFPEASKNLLVWLSPLLVTTLSN